jgi:hypothetical protein
MIFTWLRVRNEYFRLKWATKEIDFENRLAFWLKRLKEFKQLP